MAYKKGDIVFARDGNGMGIPAGTEMKVAYVYMNSHPPYVQAYKLVNGVKQGSNFTCYLSDIVPATKEERIRIYTELVKNAKEQYEHLKADLEFYTKYECEEDYTADKIARIMSSGGDVKAIAEILKERRTRIL